MIQPGDPLIIIRKSYTPEEYPPIVDVVAENIRQLSPTEIHFLCKIIDELDSSCVEECLDD